MAIRDVVITVKGDQAQLASVVIYPQVDGSAVMVAVGVSKDSAGERVGLKEARIPVPAGVKVVDDLLARALSELRKANGLE